MIKLFNKDDNRTKLEQLSNNGVTKDEVVNDIMLQLKKFKDDCSDLIDATSKILVHMNEHHQSLLLQFLSQFDFKDLDGKFLTSDKFQGARSVSIKSSHDTISITIHRNGINYHFTLRCFQTKEFEKFLRKFCEFLEGIGIDTSKLRTFYGLVDNVQ